VTRAEDILAVLRSADALIGESAFPQALEILDRLKQQIGSLTSASVDFYHARALYFSGNRQAALIACEEVLAQIPARPKRSPTLGHSLKYFGS
jgi:hypothetical protein